jgi:hypothetical protein
MRKVFYLGAAGLVASASIVYLAADYACRHPDSWVTRCLTASIVVQTDGTSGSSTPTQAGAGVGQAVCAMPSMPVHKYPTYKNRQPKLMLEPVAEECPDYPFQKAPAEACEPIQIPMPGQASAEAQPGSAVEGVISSGTEPYHKSSHKKHSEVPEECEVVPPSMPQPQVCGQEENAYMPPYPQGDKAGAVFAGGKYVEEDALIKEESDCPLCGWFTWLKQLAGQQKGHKKCKAPKASDLVPGTATGTVPCPAGMEESDPSRPPSCQEAPEYQQAYPGCPHMGGCGSGGVCCPPPATETTPKVKHHKKKKVKAQPVSMSHKAKTTADDDESPNVSGVDTMECRPSDAHLDEMDPNQLY